jgi:hypothetical protein
MTGLDHVLLHVGPEAVLRAEERGKSNPGIGGEAVCDMPELAVNRGGVADDAHAAAGQQARVEKAFRSQRDPHRAKL